MTHGHGRRNGHYRKPIVCPACGTVLAYIRPEWLILRRFLPTAAALETKRVGDAITITCQCGRKHQVEWAAIQF